MKTELNYQSYKKPVIDTPPATPEAKPTPKITIDGVVIPFQAGDTIMQAAERANAAAEIPRFCYHPGLPIAGTCRMCTVEVEKMPKLMTSCSTPAADGMIVHTQSPKVRKSRTGVMEFLLANHPLDCPVCDKAGECELQDYNFEYGPSTSRFVEEKRVWDDATTKKLSDKVTLNMNRCVHCERCVRFTDEVTKTNDLVMKNRGYKKELSATDEERGLWNDYQGCLTDFCPVGALTFNDFRFHKRVWFLDKKKSICDQCSKGCNIEVHSDQNVVERLMPVFNESVNGHWMCDEGRVSYHTAMNPLRIVSPLLKSKGASKDAALVSTTWEFLFQQLNVVIKSSKKILFIIGTDASCEEAEQVKNWSSKLAGSSVVYFNGVNGVQTSKDDGKLDHLLRMKDKTSNTRGVEALGIQPINPNQVSDADLVIYLRAGRAQLPIEFSSSAPWLLWGVWNLEEVKSVQQKLNVVGLIPGLMTMEKDGSYVNESQLKQTVTTTIQTTGHCLTVNKVIEGLWIK
ncbi:MAG: 2Fe-2S iron-sulfur cluster-binding protein [Bacteriovoracaceae bacterium]|nr:2Fe-2S iron-sulfur cluster-binding protein [Bacteriovoracaceae bacterium]